MRLLLLGLSMLPLHGAMIYVEALNSPIAATNIVDPMTGADLAGLQVTGNYIGFSVSATWQATGPASGEAAIPGGGGPLFSLSLSGPTQAPLAWQYTSQFLTPLLSLVLDGSAAGIYFDRTNPNTGVPGSGPGADLVLSALLGVPPAAPITVTYDKPVNFAGSPHDLFGKLTLDFSGIVGSTAGAFGLTPQNFSFTQDTDQTVPEPGAAVLMGIGAALLGVRWVLRRCER